MADVLQQGGVDEKTEEDSPVLVLNNRRRSNQSSHSVNRKADGLKLSKAKINSKAIDPARHLIAV